MPENLTLKDLDLLAQSPSGAGDQSREVSDYDVYLECAGFYREVLLLQTISTQVTSVAELS